MKTRSINVGDVFGLWTVLAEASRNGNGRRVYLCRCVCGNEKTVLSMHLGRRSLSCGCPGLKHGHRRRRGNRSTTYQSWMNMKDRCENPSSPSYKNYGGRGIQICERWQSFDNFLADMGERPARKTLERKDISKGYEPSNCCWATYVEQANNTRKNRRITYLGRTLTIAQWARELGVKYSFVWDRANRGLSPEQIFAQARPL